MKAHQIALLLVVPLLVPASKLPAVQAQGDFEMAPVGAEGFAVLREFFRYDGDVPLDVRLVERSEGPGYVREKLVFQGIRDSRVPAYLALPTGGEPPYPCVMLLHGIGGSKEGWWRADASHSGRLLTDGLLAAGFCVLTLDAEYHGERLANNDYESATVFTFERGWMQRTRDMVVQSVVEHRRAIDVLEARDDVDTSRIGVVGYSMGGMMTFMLAALEPRVSAAVACVPPLLREDRSPLAIHNYAPRIETQAFLLLVAQEDAANCTPEEARRLHDLIPSPARELGLYEGGHLLPPEWTARAAKWLEAGLD